MWRIAGPFTVYYLKAFKNAPALAGALMFQLVQLLMQRLLF